ncbi:MAG: tetratricopeptide repeat protein [Gemmatimonadetes bacterium]|nr:tetratricopeptide repeat protein [Gemmatimonadota bacterium]MYA76846.1 tetratricopeptide repeat protein [Gemmatimonadota bacterium]MYG15202.1 tetratricopeptide repeat protein [Gemmatimonadota bacterium]MYH19261.1 tetratricopeptide repeat protein [Gemmatimonadota bacterium]MYK97881.1 tetratricopeptide repeat protein [Gemmatimonadota bacterium]
MAYLILLGYNIRRKPRFVHKYSVSCNAQLSNGGMRMTRIMKLKSLAVFTVLVALVAAPAIQAQTIDDAKTKVDAMPDDPPRHYNLGIAYFKAGQYTNAIGAFQKAVELKADYKEAYYNLGLSQQKAGQTSNAIKSFQKATAIDAKYADAHGALGSAYQKLKNSSSAIRSYRAAIGINDKKANWHYNLGILYQTREDYPNAIRSYENYLRLAPRARNAASLRNIVAQMKDAIR